MVGRSDNPVSVLLDSLQRPKADLNLDLASHLTWRKETDKASRHVVLGKGPPGGVWQVGPKMIFTRYEIHDNTVMHCLNLKQYSYRSEIFYIEI